MHRAQIICLLCHYTSSSFFYQSRESGTGIMDYWREIVCDAGPGKVLFATAAPFVDPGLFVGNVQYDHRLDDDAKSMISGGNLRHILENWRQGRGFPDVLVIDGHIHLQGWPTHEIFEGFEEIPERAAEHVDANGVDALCAVAGGYMHRGADYRTGNDRLLAWWKALPNRIIPFFHINPNDDRQAVLAELQRMYDHGMRTGFHRSPSEPGSE